MREAASPGEKVHTSGSDNWVDSGSFFSSRKTLALENAGDGVAGANGLLAGSCTCRSLDSRSRAQRAHAGRDVGNARARCSSSLRCRQRPNACPTPERLCDLDPDASSVNPARGISIPAFHTRRTAAVIQGQATQRRLKNAIAGELGKISSAVDHPDRCANANATRALTPR